MDKFETHIHKDYGKTLYYCHLWPDGYHNEHGPAVIHHNYGHYEWWYKGNPHRTDGPAFIFRDGDTAWCINGHFLDFDVWCKIAKVSAEHKAWLKRIYRV